MIYELVSEIKRLINLSYYFFTMTIYFPNATKSDSLVRAPYRDFVPKGQSGRFWPSMFQPVAERFFKYYGEPILRKYGQAYYQRYRYRARKYFIKNYYSKFNNWRSGYSNYVPKKLSKKVLQKRYTKSSYKVYPTRYQRRWSSSYKQYKFQSRCRKCRKLCYGRYCRYHNSYSTFQQRTRKYYW